MAKDDVIGLDDPDADVDANGAGRPVAGPGFALDEQTLGQSSSVFGAGVDLLPPMVPPGQPYPPQEGYAEPDAEQFVAAPMSQRERRRRTRLEARRVRRIVRHIEPWSVLKISVFFYFFLWLVFLLAGVLLWSFAESTDTLSNIESLFESLFALETGNDFWNGGAIFRGYALATLALAIGAVAFNVLLAVLYNLLSDLTGGIRLTVIEEESARFQPPRRRRR